MKRIFFGCLTLSDSPHLRWVPGRYDGNIHRYYASGIAKSGKALLAKMKKAAKVEFTNWHIRGEVAYEISQDDIRKACGI